MLLKKFLSYLSDKNQNPWKYSDPIEIIDKYGIELYYLVKEVCNNDGSISMENLKSCINNDLYKFMSESILFIKMYNKIPASTNLNDIKKF